MAVSPETHERREAEHQGHAQRAAGDRRGTEAVQRKAVLAAPGHNRHGHHQQDHNFANHQGTKDFGTQIDLEVGQHPDRHHRPERPHRPMHVQVELLTEHRVREESEDPVQADLHRDVRRRRQIGRAAAHPHPERRLDVGGEPAARGDEPAHRGIADGEEHQHSADDEVGPRRAGAVAQADGRRCTAERGGQRGGGRHDEEHDACRADGVRTQAAARLGGRAGRVIARGLDVHPLRPFRARRRCDRCGPGLRRWRRRRHRGRSPR